MLILWKRLLLDRKPNFIIMMPENVGDITPNTEKDQAYC